MKKINPRYFGNILFALMLVGIFAAIVTQHYMFAIALSMAGMYAEIYNIRTTVLTERKEDNSPF